MTAAAVAIRGRLCGKVYDTFLARVEHALETTPGVNHLAWAQSEMKVALIGKEGHTLKTVELRLNVTLEEPE